MPADTRFKVEKKKTKYDWKDKKFFLNIIENRNVVMTEEQIPALINATKNKFGREPLFCKYSLINVKK